MAGVANGTPPDLNPENNNGRPAAAPPPPPNNNNNAANVLNNINNNNIRTRNNQNPLISVRDRLFHALFFKIALAYAQTVPRWVNWINLMKWVSTIFGLVGLQKAGPASHYGQEWKTVDVFRWHFDIFYTHMKTYDMSIN